MKSKEYMKLSAIFMSIALCVIVIALALTLSAALNEQYLSIIKYFVVGMIVYLLFAVPAKLFGSIATRKLTEEDIWEERPTDSELIKEWKRTVRKKRENLNKEK
jgi:hypothetical protein